MSSTAIVAEGDRLFGREDWVTLKGMVEPRREFGWTHTRKQLDRAYKKLVRQR